MTHRYQKKRKDNNMYEIISRGQNHYCSARCSDDERKVAPKSVVMTPQQALDMQSQGVPISTQMANADLFYEGDENSDFVPLDRRRGVDIADIYNEVEDIHNRFSGHFNDFRKTRKQKGEE